jgi:hypothetical protein
MEAAGAPDPGGLLAEEARRLAELDVPVQWRVRHKLLVRRVAARALLAQGRGPDGTYSAAATPAVLHAAERRDATVLHALGYHDCAE